MANLHEKIGGKVGHALMYCLCYKMIMTNFSCVLNILYLKNNKFRP